MFLLSSQYKELPELDSRQEKRLSRTSSTNTQVNREPKDQKYYDFVQLIETIRCTLNEFKLDLLNLPIQGSEEKFNLIYKIAEQFKTFTDRLILFQKRQPEESKSDIEILLPDFFTVTETQINNSRIKFNPERDRLGKFFGTNKSSGFGAMVYEDKECYVGGWQDEKKHGQGVYIWKDGAVFIGEFDQNKLKQGSIMYANLESYQGNFEDNKRNGSGTYFYRPGSTKDPVLGLWKDGKLVPGRLFLDLDRN